MVKTPWRCNLRQPRLQTTAPPVPESKWPDGYIEALRREGAHEKNMPYGLLRVRSFFANGPGRPCRQLGRDGIEAFLSEAVRRTGISHPQVQQARNAIETYCERFRGMPLAPRTDEERPSDAGLSVCYEYKDDRPSHPFQNIKTIYIKQSPAVNPVSAPTGRRLPAVAGRAEIKAVIAHLSDGTGMRSGELRGLRVREVQFAPNRILVRAVQALLGHANVETTMIYTHALNKGPLGVVSPADTL